MTTNRDNDSWEFEYNSLGPYGVIEDLVVLGTAASATLPGYMLTGEATYGRAVNAIGGRQGTGLVIRPTSATSTRDGPVPSFSQTR